MDEKKYKVLIADDEYWTREKLKRMIPWEKYSLELLVPVVDGEDVLRRMEEEVPDILITEFVGDRTSGNRAGKVSEGDLLCRQRLQ